jgi:DNA-binding transcriptional LysR family regulator
MEMVMKELYLLRAFVAVGQHRSFSRAAESLGVTTGSISKAIARLEANVQTRLLHRTTRSVTLTEQAQAYFLSCRRLLDELDEANRRMTQERDVDSGKLRLVVHPMLIGETFSRFLTQYRAFAPNVNLMVSIEEGPVNLYDSKYDMAVQLAGLVEQSAVIRRPLLTSSRIMVATPRYLERNGTPTSSTDLSHHTLLLPSHLRQRNCEWVELMENGNPVRVTPAASIDGNDVLLRTSAQASAGIAVLAEVMIREEIVTGKLVPVLRDCSATDGALELCLFYAHRNLLPARFRTFIDFCTAFFRDNGSPRRTNVHAAALERSRDSAPDLAVA